MTLLLLPHMTFFMVQSGKLCKNTPVSGRKTRAASAGGTKKHDEALASLPKLDLDQKRIQSDGLPSEVRARRNSP
jgi:hypothetical protein